jgi:hypothetical protein
MNVRAVNGVNAAAYARVYQQLEDARAKILHDADAHAFACDDPIGCEVRAWQPLFATDRVSQAWTRVFRGGGE